MVNIDLSKLLPGQAYDRLTTYLASFLPGLFFVLSLAFARPDIVAGFAANSERTLSLGPYATGLIGLFIAFVIGTGFILVDSFIQYLLGYAYRTKTYIYLRLCRWPLRQITQWMLAKPRWRTASLSNLYARIANRGAFGFDDWRKYQGCWVTLASRLLKARYGIEPQNIKDDEWAALYSNLGSITPEDARGRMMMVAAHASGWAGILASRIAPVLRNRYYIGFSLFLILNGLLHAYYVAKRRFDPRISGALAIRAVLRELNKLSTTETPPPESGQAPVDLGAD